MKRILAILFALMPALLSHAAALAENPGAYIAPLQMEILAGDGVSLYFRDTRADDPALSLLGMTREELAEYLAAQQAYALALDEQSGAQILFCMQENRFTEEIGALSGLPEEDARALAGRLVSQSKDAYATARPAPDGGTDYTGYWFESYALYQNEQASYIVLSIRGKSEDGAPLIGRQYYTIVNGRNIYITLLRGAERLAAQEEAALLSLVDGCAFRERFAVSPGQMLIIAGIMLAGGVTVYSSRQRVKQLERSGRRKRARTGGRSPSVKELCPHCGARMPRAGVYCHACGEWTGNSRS